MQPFTNDENNQRKEGNIQSKRETVWIYYELQIFSTHNKYNDNCTSILFCMFLLYFTKKKYQTYYYNLLYVYKVPTKVLEDVTCHMCVKFRFFVP